MGGMRGWIELCSDVNWEDYHGMWARKARDGSWYVLRWTNLYDAMGEHDCKNTSTPQYECDVKRLVIADVDVDSALKLCGWKRDSVDGVECIVNDYDGDIFVRVTDAHYEHVIVESCIEYGFGAPLETFTGDKRPLCVRAEARRYAEQCMRDADLLADRLERPVNMIGTSAEDYGSGRYGFR